MEITEIELTIRRILKKEANINKKVSITSEFIGMEKINIVKISDIEILLDKKYIMGKFTTHTDYWGLDKEILLCDAIVEAYRFAKGISDYKKKQLLISAGGKGLFTNESILSGIKLRIKGFIFEIQDTTPLRLIGSCLAEC